MFYSDNTLVLYRKSFIIKIQYIFWGGNMNTYSNPTELRITDMRFVDIEGAPKRCTILRIDTNQGISGYGEVRDASSSSETGNL